MLRENVFSDGDCILLRTNEFSFFFRARPFSPQFPVERPLCAVKPQIGSMPVKY